MGTRSREPGRRRWALLPHFEAMEVRCTPASLPTGFTEAAVATGLSRPTAMEFAPDGRLFVLEQAGNVELVRPDGTNWTDVLPSTSVIATDGHQCLQQGTVQQRKRPRPDHS